MKEGTAAEEPQGNRGISAIVLAAGSATRMGRPKGLVTVAGVPLLAHLLSRLSRSRVSEVVVVLGHESERVQSGVDLRGVRTVFNPDYRDGMSSSIRAGLRTADPHTAAFLIVLGDQPFVEPTTIDRLIDEWRRGGEGVLIPTYHGQRGNPVLVDRAAAREADSLRGDVGFRAILENPEIRVREIPVDDPGILFDMDTAEEVRALQDRLDRGVPLRDALREIVPAGPRPRRTPK